MTTQEKIAANASKLTHVGTKWGGLVLDTTLLRRQETVISAGLGKDVSLDVAMIRDFGCRVVGIDPTRLAAKTVAAAAFNPSEFTFVRHALWSESGRTLCLGGPAQTCLSPQGEIVPTISLEDILNMAGVVTFLKLDIEAAEFPVIQTFPGTFRMPQISVGFHHWLNDATDLYPNPGVECPYTIDDTRQCIEKIKGMGYKLVSVTNDDRRRVYQECLFIRENVAEDYHDLTCDEVEEFYR